MKKVDQLYAFVMEDNDGDEGIPAFIGAAGVMFPLVGADMDRVTSLMEVAQMMANERRRPIRIRRFSQWEQIGEVNPQ